LLERLEAHKKNNKPITKPDISATGIATPNPIFALILRPLVAATMDELMTEGVRRDGEEVDKEADSTNREVGEVSGELEDGAGLAIVEPEPEIEVEEPGSVMLK
jgi:hypothetical protein